MGAETTDNDAVMTPDVEVEMEEEEEEQKIFSLDILVTMNMAQNQNGLRHSDYQRYRQYCTRRIRRVRKSVGLANGKSGWKPKDLLQNNRIKDSRVLSIPLWCAERAWGYAMQLKNDMVDEQDRKRFHLLKRFSRAAQHSQQLVDICAKAADQRTQLEAEAYSALMHGNLYLQRDQPSESLEKFTHAKMAYEQLAKISGKEMRSLCDEKVTAIEPSIRYCKYVLSRQQGKGEVDNKLLQGAGAFGDLLRSKVEGILKDSHLAEAASLHNITWRGEIVAVTNEKLRVALAAARGAGDRLSTSSSSGTEISSEKQEIYQQVFSHYENALSAIRDDVRTAENERKKSSRAEIQLNLLRLLRDYVMFNKLKHTRERNMEMARGLAYKLTEQESSSSTVSVGTKLVKHDDLVHLYEKLLDNVSEQRTLLTTPNDALTMSGKNDQSSVDFDLRTLSELEMGARAMRCFFLAESYWRFSKWEQASALFTRCGDRTLEALTTMGQGSPSYPALYNDLKALKAKTDSRQCLLQADAYIAAEEATAGVGARLQQTSFGSAPSDTKDLGGSDTMIDRLDQYHASAKLVSFPPNFQSTACKPVLFDLAFNFLDGNNVDLASRVKKRKAPSKQQPKTKKPAASPTPAQPAPQEKSGWFGGFF